MTYPNAYHPKPFDASIQEIGQLCDALFQGVDESGFVTICASNKGCRAVEAVFPGAIIKWRFHADNALGWAEFSLNVIDVAGAVPDHRLPLDITRGVGLEDCNPDSLAFLLAMAARRQGIDVALIDGNQQMVVFQSSSAH